MAKLELTRSAEDYLRRKVDEWYEEAQDKRDEWYNRCLDSLNWEYERKMRDADEDEEDEVESWYNSKVRDLDYDYREADSKIEQEKRSLDSFINNSVLNRYYDNKEYVVDLKDHHIQEWPSNEFSMQFTTMFFTVASLPTTFSTSLSISSLDESDVDCLESDNSLTLK